MAGSNESNPRMSVFMKPGSYFFTSSSSLRARRRRRAIPSLILREKTNNTPDIATKAPASAWNRTPPVFGSIYIVTPYIAAVHALENMKRGLCLSDYLTQIFIIFDNSITIDHFQSVRHTKPDAFPKECHPQPRIFNSSSIFTPIDNWQHGFPNYSFHLIDFLYSLEDKR